MDYSKAAIIILLIGNMAGLFAVTTQQQPVTVNSSSPPVDIETDYIPPTQNISTQQDITVKSSKPNYIQANNHEVSFQQNGNTITVDNIDNTGPLHGTSMRPTIFSGHTLLLEDYTGQELEEGDIIRFIAESGATAHRIEGDYTFREDSYYITRGDNNDGREKVNPENITHVVKGVLYTQ